MRIFPKRIIPLIRTEQICNKQLIFYDYLLTTALSLYVVVVSVCIKVLTAQVVYLACYAAAAAISAC